MWYYDNILTGEQLEKHFISILKELKQLDTRYILNKYKLNLVFIPELKDILKQLKVKKEHSKIITVFNNTNYEKKDLMQKMKIVYPRWNDTNNIK